MALLRSPADVDENEDVEDEQRRRRDDVVDGRVDPRVDVGDEKHVSRPVRPADAFTWVKNTKRRKNKILNEMDGLKTTS